MESTKQPAILMPHVLPSGHCPPPPPQPLPSPSPTAFPRALSPFPGHAQARSEHKVTFYVEIDFFFKTKNFSLVLLLKNRELWGL